MVKWCSRMLGLFVWGLLLVLLGCSGAPSATLDGTWSCSADWSGVQNGVSVAISAVQESTCLDGDLTTVGAISIGKATWSERKMGTCFASGDELYGTWTSVETTPNNPAAVAFEESTLEGKALAEAASVEDEEYRVKVISRTDTQLEARNKEGRVISCTRL